MSKKLKAEVTVMEYTPKGAHGGYIGVFIDGGLSRGWAIDYVDEIDEKVDMYLCYLERIGFKVPLGAEGYKLTK